MNLAGWLGRLRARLGQHREALRFCLRFAAYSVVAFLLLQALEESVVVPFTRGIARAAYAILHALGAPVRLRGAVVMLPDFAVEIRNNCNAVYEIGLYAAATLAYPASAGRRLAGILLGGALLYLVNLVRVLTLIWVGALLPQSFDVAHVYVWQALFLVAVAGLWLAWVSRVRPLA